MEKADVLDLEPGQNEGLLQEGDSLWGRALSYFKDGKKDSKEDNKAPAVQVGKPRLSNPKPLNP
eukprot:2676390-Pyramimonas_sp.AAC.1